ncbi:MAG: TetR family transcriptional regulator [Jiangellaceae bacterium]
MMANQPKPLRSAATRAAILRAAQARFASDGYQKATIRAIAADADIDPSMVMRYYGSKADLFAAAVDVDLRLPALDDVPTARLGQTLVAYFLTRWEGDPSNDAMQMLLRSATTDESVAELMRSIFRRQLTPVVSSVVENPEEAVQRAGLMSSQLLGLALCRYILCLPPVASMDPDDIVFWLGPTIQRYLTGDVPRGRAARPRGL